MKKLVCSIFIASVIFSQSVNAQNKTMKYPQTAKKEVIDTYFNNQVSDPYRWLEDDRSAETAAWVTAQNQVTFAYLDQIPYRDQLRKQLTEKWNYEKISAPFVEGDYTYYFKNDGLQNQSVLYRKDQSGKEEIFLDPNTFSKDGTTSLADVSFTEDGSLVAYAISEGGSDWRKIIVLNAKDKSVIGDTLVDVKFSGISWYKNEGFYYSSYDKPTGSELSAKTDQHKLYYHQLNTPQKNDQVVFGEKYKRRYVGGYVTNDQKYLIVTAANATSGNELYIKDLTKANSQVQTVITGFDNDYSVVDSKDGKIYIETNLNAPNRKLMVVDAVKIVNLDAWEDLIIEANNVLDLSKAGGYFFAHYMKDAVSVVEQFDYSGKFIRTIELPGLGTASGFSDKKDATELYYSFTNYITPGTIYKMNIAAGTSQVYQQPKVKFNSSDYESKQVFYTSKDGTKVPMMITYKKGTKLDGTNPTMLYAYGGFNVSLTPSFSVANAVWLENGGVYAVANLRGGGEYGKKWHNAGTKMQKQNVFDDFIAAAEYLIKEKYTSSEKLAIRGGSNGGLLVGATMTQRPDLMKVALPAVGVLDMLRYHTFTAGAGWAYDYGTAEDSNEMFNYLKGYSPVHNVKAGVSYPATMVTTGDHDDRVVPAHSFKFAAELQEKNAGNNPMLIRIDVNAGHGAGKSVQQTINENADIQAFTLWNMGVTKL
ncbi:prolyl oligopeptidase family serine peptidase [Flavobacterium sp. CBA20B-1]|uniref:prolyl oligopeptidase family serine peptidase n=1 Tax=unclassified Flavobacterium TaxID=196869 RepID=UPI002224756B|nr:MULTISPECIES: prolyl oligopeptidase family serine peptidase [unclassified Flavobacterium]WCM41482.1 prolyl oligopeptidase family serine peptidase [Flavobacterium sp. CBA20B-1]